MPQHRSRSAVTCSGVSQRSPREADRSHSVSRSIRSSSSRSRTVTRVRKGSDSDAQSQPKSQYDPCGPCGPDIYTKVFGPTADETILVGLQTFVGLCYECPMDMNEEGPPSGRDSSREDISIPSRHAIFQSPRASKSVHETEKQPEYITARESVILKSRSATKINQPQDENKGPRYSRSRHGTEQVSLDSEDSLPREYRSTSSQNFEQRSSFFENGTQTRENSLSSCAQTDQIPTMNSRSSQISKSIRAVSSQIDEDYVNGGVEVQQSQLIEEEIDEYIAESNQTTDSDETPPGTSRRASVLQPQPSAYSTRKSTVCSIRSSQKPSVYSAPSVHQPSISPTHSAQRESVYSSHSVQQPFVCPTHLARQPSVYSPQSSQQPSVYSVRSAQQPSIYPSRSVQQPSVYSSHSAYRQSSAWPMHQPSAYSTHSGQQQSVYSARSAQQPSVYSVHSAQQPSVYSVRSAQQPSVYSARSAQQPSVYSAYSPQQSPGGSPRLSQEPSILSNQSPQEPPAQSCCINAHLPQGSIHYAHSVQQPSVYSASPGQQPSLEESDLSQQIISSSSPQSVLSPPSYAYPKKPSCCAHSVLSHSPTEQLSKDSSSPHCRSPTQSILKKDSSSSSKSTKESSDENCPCCRCNKTCEENKEDKETEECCLTGTLRATIETIEKMDAKPSCMKIATKCRCSNSVFPTPSRRGSSSSSHSGCDKRQVKVCCDCFTSTSSTGYDTGNNSDDEKVKKPNQMGDTNEQVGKVRYAITRITKFCSYTTFEIMKSTRKKPRIMPADLEGVFVLKSSRKTQCKM